MKRYIRLMVGVAAVSGSVGGCDASDDDSKGGGACARAVNKVRACNLLSEGDPGCDEIEDPATAECLLGCIESASCSQLEQFYCYDVDDPVSACVDSCFDEADFTCANGSVVASYSVCDGFADCPAGEDESDCPSFTCGDGSQRPEYVECDGYQDCQDGSDEAGCMLFQCGNGELLPADWECDGYADCNDGSDELGCPEQAQVTCPPGSPGAG